MGLTKKYLSESSIRLISNKNDVDVFIKYFKADAFIFLDVFSFNIYSSIKSVFKMENENEKIVELKKIMKDINDKKI